MEKYTEKDMLQFADWCRNGLTNLEYSDLYNNQELFPEWERRKLVSKHISPNSDGLERHIKKGSNPVTYKFPLSEEEKLLLESKSK